MRHAIDAAWSLKSISVIPPVESPRVTPSPPSTCSARATHAAITDSSAISTVVPAPRKLLIFPSVESKTLLKSFTFSMFAISYARELENDALSCYIDSMPSSTRTFARLSATLPLSSTSPLFFGRDEQIRTARLKVISTLPFKGGAGV